MTENPNRFGYGELKIECANPPCAWVGSAGRPDISYPAQDQKAILTTYKNMRIEPISSGAALNPAFE